MTENYLDSILYEAIEKNASDIHFQEKQIPMARLGLELYPIGNTEVTKNLIIQWMERCGDLDNLEKLFLNENTISFAFTPTVRCRAHLFTGFAGWQITVRILYPLNQVKADNDADFLKRLSTFSDGLIIASGPTGSGKTTTLWRIIEYLNESRKCHVITLEDPIEYVMAGKQALISQRELGIHFPSFGEGVRQALRQDPDVLLIGEMRDEATMEAVLTAAETGHLVLSTLHTRSASQSITRFVGAFPSAKHEEVRLRLAQVLQAVLSQRKYCFDNGEIHIIREILMHTNAVEQLIRTGKEHQLISVIQTGAAYGMRTMEQALAEYGIR